MEPGRDLAGVARLIQDVFAHELDRAGMAALREMRGMSRMRPLVWWLGRSSVEFNELLSGFVWVEEGRIVGNVTVSRAAPGSYRWIISNVAVAEAHRGRGIGRTLMDAALELIREWGGKIATLQVRHDNPPAVHLYRSMGFQSVFGTTYLRLEGVSPVASLSPDCGRLRLRQFSAPDARLHYELARAATPDTVQLERPVRLSRYRLGLETHLSDWARHVVGGGSTLRLALETNDHLGAAITAQTGTWWREGHLSLTVHPTLWGEVEEEMLSHGLHHLQRWRRRTILARHPTYHPQGIAAFNSFGFQQVRTLLWMRRNV